MKTIKLHRHSRERGQTIFLVAVSLVTILAMAALAVDVVTLYLARGEMARAADAAALAGAKALVDSGVTSDPANVNRQALAVTMATTVVQSIVQQNKVSGVLPSLVAGSPVIDFGTPGTGNPHVTVTLQRTDLPTFFSRVWASRLLTVTATAVAEAYNPLNAPVNYSPIAPKCVKPLLVANKDPASGNKFVDPTSGAAVAADVIGEPITLCSVGPCTAAPNLAYQAALVNPSAADACPSNCTPLPATDFENGIACCDSATPYTCGSGVAVPLDATVVGPTLQTETNNGVQCLVNSLSPDTLDPASLPDFSAGTGPARIIAGSGPHSGNVVTTSKSIVTLPIVDPTSVVGFLQVFLDPTSPVQGHILNVIGCGNSPGAGPPVLGGGYSPIPVRLIQ
jgi:hypothetical protein